MNANCKRCGGVGYLSIRNGDDSIDCPECADDTSVSVEVFPYKATVTQKNGFYHLSCSFMGAEEDLANSFCKNHEKAQALGRALVLACPVEENPRYIGFNWQLGETTNTGWLTFRGRTFSTLPSIVSLHTGHELGVALVQMGLIMELRIKALEWLGKQNMPRELVV